MSQFRRISRLVTPPEVSEGRGVRVKRIIGTDSMPDFDPFLMMDHAVIRKPNGFPPHPHRGFETVSYIIRGSSMHEDFKGNYGLLNEGDVQWMTAGKGIVHVEMPHSDELEGFQLWVNLKDTDKMCEPRYQDMRNSEFNKVSADGVIVKIIAGEAYGVSAPTVTRTPVTYLDVEISKDKTFEQEILPRWNAYVYVIDGNALIEGQKVGKHKAAFLNENGGKVRITGESNCRLIFLAGEKINQPIAHYGPFVMNTSSEIQQTLNDYKSQRNGFEGARNWEPRFITY